MTLSLKDYETCMKSAAPEVLAVLESSFQEASRVMSPAGLQAFMEGGKGLCNLGRGSDLVVTYLQEMPQVVKECGEDVIVDCVNAALKLASMTSGEVIALLFSSLPTAARRLGDPELLRAYLQLVHAMSAKAARGLRPMLNHSDELLSKLTISGLKRWINLVSICVPCGGVTSSPARPLPTSPLSNPISRTASCTCMMRWMIWETSRASIYTGP